MMHAIKCGYKNCCFPRHTWSCQWEGQPELGRDERRQVQGQLGGSVNAHLELVCKAEWENWVCEEVWIQGALTNFLSSWGVTYTQPQAQNRCSLNIILQSLCTPQWLLMALRITICFDWQARIKTSYWKNKETNILLCKFIEKVVTYF